ncbi:ABC transporter permease, partial [Pseudomonas aeruginosa]
FDLAAITILDGRMPPGSQGIYGDIYWAGTDAQGRDMLSAMMYGLRTSLSVGVLSGLFAMAVGTVLGLTAAYFGGRIDALIMRLVDLMLGFPTILVALMMLAILGQGV